MYHFGSHAESRTKIYGVIKFKKNSYRSETIEGMLMLRFMYLLGQESTHTSLRRIIENGHAPKKSEVTLPVNLHLKIFTIED